MMSVAALTHFFFFSTLPLDFFFLATQFSKEVAQNDDQLQAVVMRKKKKKKRQCGGGKVLRERKPVKFTRKAFPPLHCVVFPPPFSYVILPLPTSSTPSFEMIRGDPASMTLPTLSRW
jgi:hypothetical protein